MRRRERRRGKSIPLQTARDLGKGALGQTAAPQRLAEPPHGAVVGNRFGQAQSDKTPKRQTVRQRLLQLRVRQIVPALQQQSLEHRQSRISGRPHHTAPQNPEQPLDRAPVHKLLDPLQRRIGARYVSHQAVGKAHLTQQTFRHRESPVMLASRITERDFCKALAFAEHDHDV